MLTTFFVPQQMRQFCYLEPFTGSKCFTNGRAGGRDEGKSAKVSEGRRDIREQKHRVLLCSSRCTQNASPVL